MAYSIFLQEMIESKVLDFFNNVFSIRCFPLRSPSIVPSSCGNRAGSILEKLIANSLKHCLPTHLPLPLRILWPCEIRGGLSAWTNPPKFIPVICFMSLFSNMIKIKLLYLMKTKSSIFFYFYNSLFLGLEFLKLVPAELNTELSFNHCLAYEEIIFTRIMQLLSLEGISERSYCVNVQMPCVYILCIPLWLTCVETSSIALWREINNQNG